MSTSPTESTILSLVGLQINLPPDVFDHLSSQYSVLDTTSSSHLHKIIRSLKSSPADTCCRVNLIESSVDEVIDGLREHLLTLESRCHDYMVQRHDTIEDLVIIRAKTKHCTTDTDADGTKLSSCSVPPNPQDANIFPSWPKRAELGWPMSHRAVIVDRFCGEAVLRGANIFVRGILSADSGITADEEIAVYADLRSPKSKSLPRGIVLEKYTGKCVFLGIGKSWTKRADYFSQSTGVGIQMIQIAGPPQPPLNSILTGKMMLQNLPSVCVAHALDPKPGETILDMCCAPGGKTTHVASLMNNEGSIIACDKSRKKMVSARDFFQSMGASCITPLALDSTKSLLMLKDDCWKSPKEVVDTAIATKKDGLLNVKGFYPNSFDRILLDPPCSALGLRPKLLIDSQSPEELLKFADYQRAFVRNAIQLLKTGGVLTYSTCTINACENEDMVKFILDEFPCMGLVPIPVELPGLSGLPDRGLTEAECTMVRRFDSCDDTMGFFLAKFVKVN